MMFAVVKTSYKCEMNYLVKLKSIERLTTIE